MAESGRLLARAIRGKQLNLQTVPSHGAQDLLYMDGAPFPTENRNSWISSDISNAHRSNLDFYFLVLNAWLGPLLDHFGKKLSELSEINLQVETFFDDSARLICQSSAQFRIGEQSLKGFGQRFDVPGRRQKTCFFMHHQFFDSSKSRGDHLHTNRHGFLEHVGQD